MTKNGTDNNLTWHSGKVIAENRRKLLGHSGCVIWLTGLSGSGKSTIAYVLEQQLIQNKYCAFVLDGDNVRHGLNQDLGFSEEDRTENIRRIGQVAALFAQAGIIAIASFISPYERDRIQARQNAKPFEFIEVFLDVSLEICEQRDPKGLYKKARAGNIANFTGIDSPYEKPQNPELAIDTSKMSPEQASDKIILYLKSKNIFCNKKRRNHKLADTLILEQQNQFDQFYTSFTMTDRNISQMEG